MSSFASGVSSCEHTQRRARSVPSGASIRKRGPPGRLAAMSATGMLTSPKVTVPDQRPRGRDADASCFLSGTLPPLHAADARLERAGERPQCRLPSRRRATRRLAPLRLRLDQPPHARLVLVVILRRLEASFQRAHELLGETELLRVGLLA